MGSFLLALSPAAGDNDDFDEDKNGIGVENLISY